VISSLDYHFRVGYFLTKTNLEDSGEFVSARIAESLHLKIAILVLSVLTFLSSAIFYIQYRLNSEHLTKSLAATAEHLGDSLERSFEIAMLGRRLDEIQQAVEEIGRDEHVERVFIVNKTGQIKVSSDRSSLGRVIQISDPTCQVCHQHSPSQRDKTVVIKTGDNKYIRSVNPIMKKPICGSCHLDDARVLGMLVTDVSTAEVEALASQNLKISFVMFFLTIILVAWVFRVGIKRIVLNRLSILGKAATRMESGDFSVRVTLPTKDEIGQLGGTFNRMAGNLQRSIAEIGAAKAYLENLINNIEDGIAVISRERKIVSLNDKYLEMFDRDKAERNEFIGRPLGELNPFHGDWCRSKDSMCNICQGLDEDGFSNRIVNFVTRGGEEKTYESYVSIINRDEDGAGEVLEDLRDITLRKELEKQMIQTEKLASVGRLAAGVAHEINNPMASITTCAEGLINMIEDLRLRGDLTKDMNEYLQTIKSSAFRCKAITERLLNFSSDQTGDFELLGLNDIIEESIRLVEYDVSAKGVSLRCNLDPEIPEVRISRISFPQVIVNLILNSLYAVERNGSIVVETASRDGKVIMTVSDDGIGVNVEDLERVFDPFFTTKRRGEGSGLGLAICRTIVDNHEGNITIESTAGEGTRVEVILPAREKKDGRPE
jgi:two-component system NtrC family sensor kinase